MAGNNLTIADFSILASVTFLEVIDYDFSPYPAVAGWLKKLKSELSFYDEINKEALDKAIAKYKSL